MTTRAASRIAAWLVAVLGVAIPPAVARADVSVTGDAADLRVEASGDETVAVVAAIGEALGIELAAPAEVETGTVSGVYQGSLAVVLRALMPQASFVVTRRTGDERGLSVRFLGPPGEAPTASARPAGEPSEAEDPQAAAARGMPSDRRPPSARGQDPQGRAAEPAPPPPARQVY